MITTAPARGMTVEEFDRIAALPENVDRKLRLIDGEMIEKMPKHAHARLAAQLIIWIGNFLQMHALGDVFSEFRIDLPHEKNNAHVADVCAVTLRRDDVARLPDDAALPFMPDLIIEIQSAGQSDAHMHTLAAYYLAHGARMVWLAYPDRKLVEWLTPTDRRLITIDGTIDGGEVLPGFTLSMRELFG